MLVSNRFAVVTHGFANAWGHYVCCIGPLSKQFNVIAIDWIGSGRSVNVCFGCMQIYSLGSGSQWLVLSLRLGSHFVIETNCPALVQTADTKHIVNRSSRPPYKCKNCKEAENHHVRISIQVSASPCRQPTIHPSVQVCHDTRAGGDFGGLAQGQGTGQDGPTRPLLWGVTRNACSSCM